MRVCVNAMHIQWIFSLKGYQAHKHDVSVAFVHKTFGLKTTKKDYNYEL